ncbi:MAG: type I-F CRISPR-associated protein Csy3 [Magnetococcales bacterium]|nr:type I-F CRISPR-associated protein Csy3 [Magnetococcales bacterium]
MKKQAASTTIPDPSMLSFSRSLVPTDALFFSVDPGGMHLPIPILPKTVLGTASHYDKKGLSTPEPNIQRIECAMLPHDSHILSIEFGLSVVGESLAPHSCDVPEWRRGLMALAEGYARVDGFRTLGTLYAANIANGRWAWKNRLFAHAFTTTVTMGTRTWQIDSLAHRLGDLQTSTHDEQVRALGEAIASGLRGEQVTRFHVTGKLDIGHGAMVYPSQEFVDTDEGNQNTKSKSNQNKIKIGKVLFGVRHKETDRCAAFHEQKIGNAIRTIDIWHAGIRDETESQVVNAGKPLAINPYGQDREASVVVRRSGGGNADFYTLLKKGIKIFAQSQEADQVNDDLHFVMANLVRGGVYGYGGKETTTSKAEAAAAEAS